MDSGTDTQAGLQDFLLLEFKGELDHYALADLKPALLAALDDDRNVTLAVSPDRCFSAAFVQLVCAAHRSFAARGKTLRLSGLGPDARERLDALGFGAQTMSTCGVPRCPLLREGLKP